MTDAAEKPRKALKIELQDMDDAPDDGKPVLLYAKPDAEPVEAYWRHSRMIDPKLGKWVPTAYWALRHTSGLKVGWTPVGWRPAT